MMNPFTEVDWHPDRARRRSFAVSLVVGFPCLALAFVAIASLRGHAPNWILALGLGGGGAAAGLLFLLLPSIARPFYVAWYFLACCVGFVVGNTLMALVYYVFVAGPGLAMRVLGRRGQGWTINRPARSYWLDAGPPRERRQYYRQF